MSREQIQEGKLVLAFGDSLYAGYGLAPNEAFPAQLEKALRQQGVVATVHNAGVSGDTSAAGLQRLNFTLDGLPRTPELAIVGLGGNDMLRGLDPAATRANLLEICQQLRRRGIKVVLTGMVAAPNLGRDYSSRFNALFPQVATQCGATLYPFFLDGVITDRTLMLPDRLHPNGSGVHRIVAKIQPMIARELLRED
ncbi:MAG: arylesterase [Sphingomicrobium sp.]